MFAFTSLHLKGQTNQYQLTDYWLKHFKLVESSMVMSAIIVYLQFACVFLYQIYAEGF